MSLTETASIAGDAVQAPMSYAVWTGVKPVNETGGPDGLMRRTTGTYEKQVVSIANGRRHGEFGLDASGFELASHPTRMHSFFDADELHSVYYPEMQRLIAERSGARRVHVFDHTLRSSDEDRRAARRIREPVKSVHNDYTEWSGPQRLRDLLPGEAEMLSSRRFAIIQVWRAIDRPVERNPLAVIDARSLAPEDLIASERRFPDRVGEIYLVRRNPGHRWIYFPRMLRDEALVFKVYDSDAGGPARWCAHSSFDDPTTPTSAPPRESIEIRAFAFF
ncbi:MAG TPA: CmcJ/NvfI family oxidoreductase [Caulobacteraceae bacterium]|nr:CmcJ/NvfI family oxidoreductase [Caulobacteraceae bacterium]